MDKKQINIYSVKQVRESSGLYELDNIVVSSPGKARDIIQLVLDLNSSTVERFGIISLSTKNRVNGIHVISVGILNSTLVHPRDVFQAAILNNACGIVLFHNHPSGDPEPSREDVEMTRRFIGAGEIMGIPVLDHVIVGDGRYISFKEQGLL